MMSAFVPINQELPCPPEKVRELAAEGKNDEQIAGELRLGLSTFRARVRNSREVAEAWRDGRLMHAKSLNSRVVRTRRKSYEDQEFDYTVPFQPDDFKVLLAVACGLRRRNKIARVCLLSVDFVVLSLDRLEVNLLVTKDESGFFDEYEVYYAEKQKGIRINCGYFLLLFTNWLKNAK